MFGTDWSARLFEIPRNWVDYVSSPTATPLSASLVYSTQTKIHQVVFGKSNIWPTNSPNVQIKLHTRNPYHLNELLQNNLFSYIHYWKWLQVSAECTDRDTSIPMSSKSGIPFSLAKAFRSGEIENLEAGFRPLWDWVVVSGSLLKSWPHLFSDAHLAVANSQSLSVGEAGEAFVTLVTSDSYCMGAVVVARSLRRHGTTRSVVVMVTPNVSEQSRWATLPFPSPLLRWISKPVWSFTPPGAPSTASLMRSSWWTGLRAGTVCTCPLLDVLSLASPLPRFTAGPWLSTANACSWMPTHW